MNIVFIHGRAQEDRDESDLTKEWVTAFSDSFGNAGLALPTNIGYKLPYYGKDLISLRNKYQEDIAAGKYRMKSISVKSRIEGFEREFIEELLQYSGIQKKIAIAEFDREPIGADHDQQTKGLENNRQFLAFTRAIDKHWRWAGNTSIQKFTDDVAAYLMVPNIQNEINGKIQKALDDKPTIVIAHSLGTIVAYEALRELLPGYSDIRAFITLGSPLGVRAVQRQLNTPYHWPSCLNGPWINIYDPKDIVSLNPLDEKNFKTTGAIRNIIVTNESENRHHITPYLSCPEVANSLNELFEKEKIKI